MPVGYLHLNLMFYYTLNTRWDNVISKREGKGGISHGEVEGRW